VLQIDSSMCGSCSGVDALSEDEIEDAQHSGQPVADFIGRWAAEGNPGLEDPLLGTDDPLLHRRGLDEEPGGHLGGGQPREEAQDEHDAFVLAQSRVGAGEEQSEALVGQIRGIHLLAEALRVIVVVARSQLVLDAQAGEVPGAHVIGADEIDGAVLRRGHQPRLWAFGHSPARPCLDRAQHGVVEGLLGEVEVTEPGDQRREQPPVVLLADGAEDAGGRIGVGIHQ
jgi:hypothetical protein